MISTYSLMSGRFLRLVTVWRNRIRIAFFVERGPIVWDDVQ